MTTYNELDAQTLDELLAISKNDAGIGARLLAEYGSIFELAKNLDGAKLTDRQRTVLRASFKIHFVADEKTPFNSPADAAAILKDISIEPKEHLVVLVLDRKNKLLKRDNLYVGSVNSSQVRVSEIFKTAISLNGSAIIVAHNHPSGDPTPSPDDVALTRALVQAGKLLDIDVLDHIVIGAEKWVSLKERGLGFN